MLICILFLHSSSLLFIINKFPIDELIICSLNVRGLSTLRGEKLFVDLEWKHLEYSFFKKSTVSKKKNDCGHQNGASQLFLAVLLAQVQGYASCLTKTFNSKSRKQFSDRGGRFILETWKQVYGLGKHLCPKRWQSEFFLEMFSADLLSFECEDIILSGDLNLALDVQNDKGGRLTTHKNSLKEVQDIINSPDLMNIWRVSNPDIKRFT